MFGSHSKFYLHHWILLAEPHIRWSVSHLSRSVNPGLTSRPPSLCRSSDLVDEKPEHPDDFCPEWPSPLGDLCQRGPMWPHTLFTGTCRTQELFCFSGMQCAVTGSWIAELPRSLYRISWVKQEDCGVTYSHCGRFSIWEVIRAWFNFIQKNDSSRDVYSGGM